MKYRLGLDLGTNSLGWAVLALDANNKPEKIVRIGSRIFPTGRHPKDDSSLAVQRRVPRQQRRRRDRYIRRREKFIKELVRFGFFPETKTERQQLVALNPYRLRAEGLRRELTPYELGRALFHLQQRRGFKSNRKTDKSSADGEKELQGMKGAIEKFRENLGDDQTVGSVLWQRIQNGEGARARRHGEGNKATYTFYVDRSMVEHEFDALWDAQKAFHSKLLSQNAYETLKDTLLYQRDLLPQDVGTCLFERDDKRAPLALVSSQLFRLYQEVNHLRLRNLQTLETRALTRTERDAIIADLTSKKEAPFKTLRKVALGKADSDNWRFTIEDERRIKLLGDQTSSRVRKIAGFEEIWDTLELSQKDALVERLINEENERVLLDEITSEFNISFEIAEQLSALTFPDSHLRLGKTAILKILPQLIDGWDETLDQPLTYDKAVLTAGYRSHSEKHDGTIHDLLPYYGEILHNYTMPAPKGNEDEKRWGKIGNPTVHIGLNQIRKVVNELIKTFGSPEQVVVEVARDLKRSAEAKTEIRKLQTQNQRVNDDIRKRLAELNVRDNYENRLRMRLWDELGAIKQCVYTGKMIPLSELFTNEFQIDHILPLSDTLDDSYANKVLVKASANRFKGKQSPYQAFGSSPAGYNWDEILDRANTLLPRNKVNRFSAEALSDDLGQPKDFLARQLNDTAYLARVAKQYLGSVCVPSEVWVTPGRLTGMLRGKWNLNVTLSDSGKKERTDHRHHAIDAVVIALTDRGLLNRVSRAAGRAEEQNLERSFTEIDLPWPTFRQNLIDIVDKVVVSYRPDHGTGSRLHNDTAYGIVSGPDAKGKYRVHHRVPLETVREKDLPDLQVGSDFKAAIEQAILIGSTDLEIKANLQALAEQSGRRSVRKEETLSVIPIYRKGEFASEGAEPYKGYKGDSNYCYEIFRTEKGKWDGRIISSFEAQSNAYRNFQRSDRYRTTTWSGESLVMRIMNNDALIIEADGIPIVVRVQRLTEGKITLVEHFEANVDARNRDKQDSLVFIYKTPNALRGALARRIFVDPIGRLLDPGFRE